MQQRWRQVADTVRWEDLEPVAPLPVMPRRSWGPGWWGSATTGGHVMHGSVAMRTQLMVLDCDPAVTRLAARPVRLVWRDPCDGQPRSWVPQVFARYADGGGLLADCPAVADAGGARARRAAQIMEAACTAVGWTYRRLAPPDPVTVANLRWLAGYRHPRNAGDPGLTCRTLITYPETLTLAAALTRIPPHGLTRTDQPRFLHHLAARVEIHHLTPATNDPLRARINNH